MEELRSLLPGQWMDTFWLGLQIVLILMIAFVLQRMVGRGLKSLGERYPLPTSCWCRCAAPCAG